MQISVSNIGISVLYQQLKIGTMETYFMYLLFFGILDIIL